MRILGIDPGSNVTGWGIVERGDRGGLVHVAHGTLRPPRGSELPSRLAFLHERLAAVIEAEQPDLAAVEEIFVARSARSALVLGHARGVALAALAAAGLPVSEYGTRSIKLAVTGDGAAAKAAVQRMVRRLLTLPAAPPMDAADALAAAICHAQAAGRPVGRTRRSGRGRGRAARFVMRVS
jgi:crossover junction endodeoxyribonuclease RuvC